MGGIAPLVILAYFVLAEALFERTIGKELMGLRAARLDGKRLDLWSAFVRNISKIAFILLIIDVAAGLGPMETAGKSTATAILEPSWKPQTTAESFLTGSEE